MPDITNPQIVLFTGTYGRAVAEELVKAYDTMKQYRIEWTRLLGQASVPNTSDQIADGSQSSLGNSADGRAPVTGQVLTAEDALAALLITAFETTATVGGVTKARVEFMRDIAVNRVPRF